MLRSLIFVKLQNNKKFICQNNYIINSYRYEKVSQIHIKYHVMITWSDNNGKNSCFSQQIANCSYCCTNIHNSPKTNVQVISSVIPWKYFKDANKAYQLSLPQYVLHHSHVFSIAISQWLGENRARRILNLKKMLKEAVSLPLEWSSVTSSQLICVDEYQETTNQ